MGGVIPPPPEDKVDETIAPVEPSIPDHVLSDDGNGSFAPGSVDVTDSTTEASKGDEGAGTHR